MAALRYTTAMPQLSALSPEVSVQVAYDQRVSAGELEPDAAQAEMVAKLGQLQSQLAAFDQARKGLFRRLTRRAPKAPPPGLYIHGGVGRGKTMLMDLFFATTGFEPRLRMHFHEFMSDVHDRIGAARRVVDGDPIAHVAKAIAPGPLLLCFDEFHVTDIADAMIIGRLFRGLFAQGTVLVATSNAAPENLYRNGLNRQLFLPFIDLLEDHTEIHEMLAAKDFRLEKLAGHPLYFTPVDEEAKAAVDAHWQRLTGGHPPSPADLEVKTRSIHVPAAAMGVARFRFDDLCAKPLGPRDYLTIAHNFHTILIEGIPVLKPAQRNEARRFINLVDALYDNRVGLIASAEAQPPDLYATGDGADLFERTASRLIEMRSESYLAERDQRAEDVADTMKL